MLRAKLKVYDKVIFQTYYSMNNSYALDTQNELNGKTFTNTTVKFYKGKYGIYTFKVDNEVIEGELIDYSEVANDITIRICQEWD